MILRPPVDAERLEALLQALGREVPVPVRLYLQGGSISVRSGVRPATMDIDYAAEVGATGFGPWMTALTAVAQRLQINVEAAGAGDFIPLPEGWQGRCAFAGQYGKVAVHTFDPYSTALAKLARGNRTDLEDVRHLVSSAAVDPARLRAMALEIAPRWNERLARQTATTFLAKVDAWLAAIAAAAPPPPSAD